MTLSDKKDQRSAHSGRPKQIDRRRVSLLALAMFERDGFDRVTMADIAVAAAVSRRTLFREFPTKGELVWDGLDNLVAAIRTQTKVAHPGATLHDLIEVIVVPALQVADEPAAVNLARRRLRIIAATPELLHHKTLNDLREVVTAMLIASGACGDRPATLVTDALVAVGFSASLWWATHEGESTLVEAFRIALSALS